MHNKDDFDYSVLDKGIRNEVKILRKSGIETFESCEGGKGHAFFEPTIRFHGNQPEGLKAVSVAMYGNLKVAELRRVYRVDEREMIGPWWELTFVPTTGRN